MHHRCLSLHLFVNHARPTVGFPDDGSDQVSMCLRSDTETFSRVLKRKSRSSHEGRTSVFPMHSKE